MQREKVRLKNVFVAKQSYKISRRTKTCLCLEKVPLVSLGEDNSF